MRLWVARGPSIHRVRRVDHRRPAFQHESDDPMSYFTKLGTERGAQAGGEFVEQIRALGLQALRGGHPYKLAHQG